MLQVVENDLAPPARGEVRIKVLAAAVSRRDVTVRRSEALYSGTWLGQKFPFTPGYAVIGEVEAVGENVREVAVGARVGVLTVIGGYTEVLYWRADRLMPVPAMLDPALAVPLILNYIVAHKTMHRVAKARAGEKYSSSAPAVALARRCSSLAAWRGWSCTPSPRSANSPS